MAKKIFGNEIEPKCAYCARCILTEDKKIVLCEKKGFTTPDDSCKKFIYDPLKRVPKTPSPTLPDYDDVDFSLNLEDEN